MQLATKETLDALASATWVPVLSLLPAGEAECQCIRTAHPSGLYITRDGMITHNSSPPDQTNLFSQSSEVERQHAETIRAHKEDGKPLPAPNGKPSKLNLRQWIHVRTPNFKRWFGDWESVANATPRRASSTFGEAQSAAKAFAGIPITNKSGMVATVSGSNIGKMLNEKAANKSANPRAHALAVANLDQLFTHAELLDSHPDKTQEPTIVAIHRFYAPLLVDGKALPVKMTVKETRSPKNPNQLYTVEMVDFAEKRTPAGQLATDTAIAGTLRNAPIAGVSERLRRMIESVNPDSVSKVVDENGEPLVAFDPAQIKSATGNNGDYSDNPSILRSQSDGRQRKIDDLEAKATAEVDGARTVGDPRLAHSADSTQWMAFDELRKAEFEKQRERDWQAVAERMVRDDYAGVREALLDAAATATILTPVQTKAAQILIAAESAKPRTPERRVAIYQLIEAYRATGAEAGRALTARRDPLRTPAQRWAAFFADRLYTPPGNVRRAMERAIWERQKIAEIARLRQVIAQAANTGTAAAAQARDDIARLEAQRTKEDLLQLDYDLRVKKIEAALAKMGVTLDDIFHGEINLTLVGSAIVKNALGHFAGRDRAILRDLQGKHGGNISEIAKRHNVSRQAVTELQKKAEAELRAKFLEKARRGITDKELESEGIQDALFAQQADRAIPTEAEAQAMADRMMRKAGFFGADHDRVKIRQPRKKAKPYTPGPIPSDAPVPADQMHRQPGLNLPPGEFQRPANWEYMPPAERRLWEEKAAQMPQGEGRTTPTGRLDLEDARAWEGATPGEGRTTATGNLGLDDETPWEGATAYKLDPENIVDMLHVKRAMDIADGNHSWVDYVTEIGIANLLSAPVTAITNLTGFAYSAYEMTIKKVFKASYNSLVAKSADADQWAEFGAMGRALAPAIARAWVNAKNAWATESPIFEQQVLDQDAQFDFMDSGIKAHIAGTKGRIIRAPFRALLASDEFMKTLIGTTHAAAVALRSGKAQGLAGPALENYIGQELGERGSRSWAIAAQEAQRLTFQTKLRSIQQWKKLRDEGELGLASPIEFGLRLMQDFKSIETADAGIPTQMAVLLASMFFPFVRTPYRLLELGVNETIFGAANSLLHTSGKVVLRDANGKKITHDLSGKKLPVHYVKGDAARVAAAATAIHAALLTLALLMAGEGDDDDDDKLLLISGSAFGENKEITSGLRKHLDRTMPPNSVRIGGKNGIVFSYQRLDPFSTAIATTVDWLKNIKQAAAGKRDWHDASGKIAASLYAQVLDKASLRGFSQLSDLLSGASSLPEYAAKQAAAWAVPNLIRNPARNSDPFLRETKGMTPAQQLPYQLLPIAALAPPVRRDVFGAPMQKEGSFVSRTVIPGNPRPAPKPNSFDVALRKYNLRNPSSAYAPSVPNNTRDSDQESFKYTPRQYERFTKLRGENFRRLLTEEGYMQAGRRLRADDIVAIKKLGGEATREANKALGN